MLELEAAACRVLDSWEKGDLASAVRDLDLQLHAQRELRVMHSHVIGIAKDRYAAFHGEPTGIEVDDAPYLCKGDQGLWVSAWLFIPNEEVHG